MPLDIPIGREARLAHWRALSDLWAQVQIDTPAEALAREATQPTPEFTTSPVFQLRGGRYQVIAWLPGEHPQECGVVAGAGPLGVAPVCRTGCAAVAALRAVTLGPDGASGHSRYKY